MAASGQGCKKKRRATRRVKRANRTKAKKIGVIGNSIHYPGVWLPKGFDFLSGVSVRD